MTLCSARDKLSAVCSSSLTSSVVANRTASWCSGSRRRCKFCCSASTRSRRSLSSAGSSSEGPASFSPSALGGALSLVSGFHELLAETCSAASLGSAAGSAGAPGFSSVSAPAASGLFSDGVMGHALLDATRHCARRSHRVVPPAAQPEGEHQQRDPEEKRVGSDPPSQHHSPDQRPDD